MSETPPRLNDTDFADLTEHIRDLLEKFEGLPFPNVKEDVFELLNCLDFLHRETLSRMLERIEMVAPALIPEFERDYAIRATLMLYNFMPEEPQAASSASSTFIPLDQITVSPAIKMPVWIPGGNIAEIPPGTFKAKTFEDVEVLLGNLEGQLYAYQNACLDSILPLDRGQLEGHLLICPWHGCHYDLRSGEIQNGSGLKLKKYPLKVGQDGRFTVGFNIPGGW
jgi:nitrite reductase/ring-hydroxylating ferredoxin subunit